MHRIRRRPNLLPLSLRLAVKDLTQLALAASAGIAIALGEDREGARVAEAVDVRAEVDQVLHFHDGVHDRLECWQAGADDADAWLDE